MRQRDVTGLEPANDNPAPLSGQGELFHTLREVVTTPVSIGDPILILSGHASGSAIIHELLERGGGVPHD